MKKIWDGWKVIVFKLGDFQFKILFSFLYFVLLTPLGFITSFFTDPLDKKSRLKWCNIKDNTSTVGRMLKQ